MADLTFTTIEESARHSLNISRDEYAACNYVQTWAAHPANKTPGYCNRTRGQMALFVGITERGMQKMLTRLEGMDLIKRASKSQFLYRITEKWFDVVVSAKEQRTGEQSSRQRANKVPGTGEQSSRQRANKVPGHKEYNKEVIESVELTRFAPLSPGESETLKAEEVKRGLVAPPAETADPTHMVTEIKPEQPGTRIVSPFTMPPRVDTVDEAEAIIMEWAKGDGRESVRKWYADAARQCTAVDVTAMVSKFAGVYLTIGDEGKRQRMARDPLQFFKYTFKSFLKTEKSFGVKPTQTPPTQQTQSVLPKFLRER